MGLKARVLVAGRCAGRHLVATACVPPPVDPGTTTTTGATTADHDGELGAAATDLPERQ